MRSTLLFTILAAASAAAFAPASGAPSPRGNIVAAATTSPDHKTLVAAVRAADLVSTLASGGPFTLFAPTDAAFAKLPDGTLETLLDPANKALLQSILTYHVVPGAVTSSQLIEMIEQGGGSTVLTSVQGGMLTASIVDGQVVITDATGGTATVVAADLVQSNGVIHATDAVSLPQ